MKKRIATIIVIAAVVLTTAGLVAAVYFSGKGLSGKLAGNGTGESLQEQSDTSAEITETSESSVASASGESTSPDSTPTSSDTGSSSETSTSQDSTTNSSDNTSSIVSGETIVPGENPFQKIKVKAIYLTGVSAGIEKTLNHVIELINTTELNAVVIDIKEGGVVNYPSNVPEVQKYGLFVKYYNPEAVLKKLHDNNIFVIGRLVCFRDNGLAKVMPELGVKRTDGTLWKEGGSSGGFWTNPYKEDVWKYNVAIAKEAAQLGFDEIQFDYVRFPTVKKSEVNYGSNVTTKVDAISGFLKYAAEQLHTVNGGVPVSADVFGIICESPSDGAALGQDLKRVGLDIDYICPMVYPSHYANASKGPMGNGTGQTINGVSFTAPDLKPYEVVYNTLMKGKVTIDAISGYRAKVRPYLQDFTATYLLKGYYQVYGAEQVRQQIKAVYDAGCEEWILWNGRNIYSEDAFLKE